MEQPLAPMFIPECPSICCGTGDCCSPIRQPSNGLQVRHIRPKPLKESLCMVPSQTEGPPPHKPSQARFVPFLSMGRGCIPPPPPLGTQHLPPLALPPQQHLAPAPRADPTEEPVSPLPNQPRRPVHVHVVTGPAADLAGDAGEGRVRRDGRHRDDVCHGGVP